MEERGGSKQTIKHNRTHPKTPLHNTPHIPRLLPQLAQRARLRRLPGIHQPGGDLDHDRVGGRAPLLLQHDARGLVRRGRVVEDGCDADGVDAAVLGAREALCGLPEALVAVGVEVGYGDEGGPFGVFVGLGRGVSWWGWGWGMGWLTRGEVLRTLEGFVEALLGDAIWLVVLVVL